MYKWGIIEYVQSAPKWGSTKQELFFTNGSGTQDVPSVFLSKDTVLQNHQHFCAVKLKPRPKKICTYALDYGSTLGLIPLSQVEIKGQLADRMVMGRTNLFAVRDGEDTQVIPVEEVALRHYREQGYPQGATKLPLQSKINFATSLQHFNNWPIASQTQCSLTLLLTMQSQPDPNKAVKNVLSVNQNCQCKLLYKD